MDRVRLVRFFFLLSAFAIAAASLGVSHFLVRDLSREERSRMEVWAEAMRSLSRADEGTDLALVLKVLESNNTIPVVVLDERGQVGTTRNVSSTDTLSLHAMAEGWMRAGRVVRVVLSGEGEPLTYMDVAYDESLMLHRLALYPYVQLCVVLLFVALAVYVLVSQKRAEQNKVWVGLSKETAHQLGTPISSLMAWVEVLREAYPDDELLPEMSKDVGRLERIAERFSKIGSLPEPVAEDLCRVVASVAEYMGRRVGKSVRLETQLPPEPLTVRLCAPLFEWVLENLCKNAVDAMEGHGTITITARAEGRVVSVEVQDTGKGIAKNRFKTVFNPGYTTKQRGWGLGLSLAKRIVEEYHRGRIYVKSSEPRRGTTFRIELKSSAAD